MALGLCALVWPGPAVGAGDKIELACEAGYASLAPVPADHPSRSVEGLLGKARDNYGVETSVMEGGRSRGKWVRGEREIRIRDDLFDASRAPFGKSTVVHESTHMTTDLKNVVERKTTFASDSAAVYGDQNQGVYSSRVRADEVDARVKQAASLRLDRLRAEQELAGTKGFFARRRVRSRIDSIAKAEKAVVDRARLMIARERQLTEGALKQIDDPRVPLPVSKPKSLDGFDRFIYRFRDADGATQEYRGLIPQFKDEPADDVSKARAVAIYRAVEERFGKDSVAARKFPDANSGEGSPVLSLERDAVPTREVRAYSVSTGIDDVQLNGFVDAAAPGGRKAVEASLLKRLDQLDARAAHLERHYGPPAREYRFGPAEAGGKSPARGRPGPAAEPDEIEEAATAGARPWGEEASKAARRSPYAERAESVYRVNEPPPARAPATARDPAPKNSFLAREHAQFTAIGPEDNKNFIALAAKANAGEETAVKRAATMQAAVGKALNDVVIRNKDRVNQLFNLQKDLIWNKISGDELLGRHLVGRYSDFNTVKLAFDSADPRIDRKLAEIFTEYNRRYSGYLDSVAKAEGWDRTALGLAAKRENWHHLGIGGTPDEANLAARKSRELLDENGLSRPRAYEEVKGAIHEDLAAIERRRVELENKFGDANGMFTGEKGERVLSAEASEAIRKAEQTDAGVRKALERQFDTRLNDSEVKAFRDYVARADSFSPDLYVAERIDVPLDARRNGIVSADFKGQNARNLEETMKALARNRGKPIEEQVRVVRAGEEEATRALEARKAGFRRAVREQFGGIDPEWEKHVYFTGDDGIYLPAKKLSAEEKAAFASRFSSTPDNLRLTFGRSSFADNAADIPRTAPGGEKALSDFVVEAEKVEKDLRKGLMGEFRRDVANGTQLVVDLTPRSDGTCSVGIYLGGRHTPEQRQRIRAWIQKYLRGRGDDLSFVRELDPGRR